MTTENINSGLDITDIQGAVEYIDMACNEGAYKGWETISRVAAMRTRFVNFLEVVAAAQKAQAEQNESAPTTGETDAVATTDQNGSVGSDGPSGPSGPDEAAIAPGA